MAIQLKFLLAVLNRPAYHIIINRSSDPSRQFAFIFFNKKLLIKEMLDETYFIFRTIHHISQIYTANNVIFTSTSTSTLIDCIKPTFHYDFAFPSRVVYIHIRNRVF